MVLSGVVCEAPLCTAVAYATPTRLLLSMLHIEVWHLVISKYLAGVRVRRSPLPGARASLKLFALSCSHVRCTPPFRLCQEDFAKKIPIGYTLGPSPTV